MSRIAEEKTATMKLRDLMAGVEVRSTSGPPDAEIYSVAYDSRKVEPGALFFALRGEKLDGMQFAAEAVKRGAVAVAGEAARPATLPANIGWIELAPGSQRRGLAIASANFFGHPAQALKLVGVTGTNGKTTTTYLIDSILRAAGFTTGRIGTTGYQTPRGLRNALTTTPESLELQQMFAEIRDAGGTHAVLEASSHALAMSRLWGCHFAVAIFTNLTRDHLDYHKTFDEYFAAKLLLFEGTGAGAPDAAVLNIDDPYAAKLKGLAGRTLTYSQKNGADIAAKKVSLSFQGIEFTAESPIGNISVRSPLVGRFNVYNILASIGAGVALGIPAAQIESGIAKMGQVPGRFERVDEGQSFLVIVDYAHTDDALRNVISAARELGETGRIITLFGAGGERDRTKRPLMGEAAGSLSDFVVVTSDNPRSEDPLGIINDVVVGLQKPTVKSEYVIEPDRERAMEMAIGEARPGDIVLLAGKGHETYQVLGDKTIEFDDRAKARAILKAKGFSRSFSKKT